MARIKHIAIATQDAEATARFYIEALGLKEVGKVDSPAATGYYLSDGNVNVAILNYRSEAAAGAEYGAGYSGIHHIGFAPREDINQALQLQMDGPRRANVEVKYRAPDGVIIDISETGWVGTRGLEGE